MKHFFKSLVVMALMLPAILLDVVLSLCWPSKNWTLIDLLFDWLCEYNDDDL